MKRALLIALLTGATLTARAQSLHYMRVYPELIRIHVGEVVRPQANAIFGGFSSGYKWKFQFGSGNESIAGIVGDMEWPQRSADLIVVGRKPGVTYVLSPEIGYGVFPLATIEVTCAAEAPVTPAAATLRTEPHRPVTLQLTGPSLPGQTFSWYLGRIGDTSRPLAGAGPELPFAPEDFGTYYVWVLSKSTCSTSMAEFRVDAPLPRRRSVSRS